MDIKTLAALVEKKIAFEKAKAEFDAFKAEFIAEMKAQGISVVADAEGRKATLSTYESTTFDSKALKEYDASVWGLFTRTNTVEKLTVSK